MEELFKIEKFNIIQDEENYYFFRALNMADSKDIESGETISEKGNIEKIRTDRQRYIGEARYEEGAESTLEEVFDHIKARHRTDTSCISLTCNANVAIDYGRSYYKDNYVMIRIPKVELSKDKFFAGLYMLQELLSRIEEKVKNAPEEKKQKILKIFSEIDKTSDIEKLKEIIKAKYTGKKEDKNPERAHLRKGITYANPNARISNYQALDEEQLLELNKVYAKLAIVEYEGILKHVINHASNSKLREAIGNAFSSVEVIHYGEISNEDRSKEEILEVPKEIVDIFALIQQIEGIDKEKVEVEGIKKEVLKVVREGKEIPRLPAIEGKVKDRISIEEMYNLTEGKVEYGEASLLVKNLFYLSRSRYYAIKLGEILEEITNNNPNLVATIEYIKQTGFRIEPEIITRKSGTGIQLSSSVNLDIPTSEKDLVEKIKSLREEELREIVEEGGIIKKSEVQSKIFERSEENEKIPKERYYAEAILAQYDWKKIGIQEFSREVKNKLIKKFIERNCIKIYKDLKSLGIEEEEIPKIIVNLITKESLYEEYEKGNLKKVLEEKKEAIKSEINAEILERFLGYYDVPNTGIKLKKYQQRAFDRAVEIFKTKKFAQIILPTGAGKSFVTLALMLKHAQEHPNEKMLYLAPQDEIIGQIKKYIVRFIHGNVGTIDKTEDEIIKEVFPNLTFATYPNITSKSGKKIIKEKYGFIVVDEDHRTGAPEYEKSINELYENQDENVKVLGITATPTRDVDGKDMAEENARKLGYTEEEIKKRKYLASNMSLESAIKMGYVVNPKVVFSKYEFITSGKMQRLKEEAEEIVDENIRKRKLSEYEDLEKRLIKEIDEEIGEEKRKQLEEEGRKQLERSIGQEEIIRKYVKKGQKFIVFIPVTDQGEIEDEDGNRIGAKTGEDKIISYQEYLSKIFDGTDTKVKCNALLGAWSKERNRTELEDFETRDSDEVSFLVVMNKANEGLHTEKVNGEILLRALDKNSRILCSQIVGRVIYAIDEENPISDEERPIILDLANNLLTVKMEKEFEKKDIVVTLDDIELLSIIVEWIQEHNGRLPDGNSTDKEEKHYYSVLRKIQKNTLNI